MASKKSPNPIDVHVGARVRLRRMMVGMSQETLGAHLGITFQQIQKYEKGTNRIGASRVQAIARVLSVPVSFFFEDAPGQTPELGDQKFTGEEVSPLIAFLGTTEGITLNTAFVQIASRRQRTALVSMAQALAGAHEEA